VRRRDDLHAGVQTAKPPHGDDVTAVEVPERRRAGGIAQVDVLLVDDAALGRLATEGEARLAPRARGVADAGRVADLEVLARRAIGPAAGIGHQRIATDPARAAALQDIDPRITVARVAPHRLRQAMGVAYRLTPDPLTDVELLHDSELLPGAVAQRRVARQAVRVIADVDLELRRAATRIAQHRLDPLPAGTRATLTWS